MEIHDAVENEDRLDIIEMHYNNAVDSIAEQTAIGLRGGEFTFFHPEIYPTVLARLADDGIKYQVLDRNMVDVGNGMCLQVTVLLVW